MAFIPPKPNAAVIAVTRWALPAILRSRGVVGVEWRSDDLRRLRGLSSERVALLPNHPTETDPAILYHLGKAVRQRFHFLCSRETFRLGRGCFGWLVQHVGGYSIVRGRPDFKSFKMTRALLAQPGSKLVMFPEGEVYSQNDTLLPFHSGLTRLLFWVQEDIFERDPSESLHVVPVAVRYRFTRDMRPAIGAALSRLEGALALPDGRGSDPYSRLRTVGETVVDMLVEEYAVPSVDGAGLQTRMVGVKTAIIGRVAGALRVTPSDGELPDKIRHLMNVLNDVTGEEPDHECAYDARLWHDHQRRVRPLMRDLRRLANWMAVHDGYVGDDPTPERMAETIRRLELEVLGRIGCVGPQRCHGRLGDPIKLADWLERYREDGPATVDALTDRFEEAVRGLLEEMRGRDTPFPAGNAVCTA